MTGWFEGFEEGVYAAGEVHLHARDEHGPEPRPQTVLVDAELDRVGRAHEAFP